MFSQAVPRLGDDLIDAVALWKTVVLRPRAVELRRGVEHAPQQVGRQKAALGANGLEIGGAAGHLDQAYRSVVGLVSQMQAALSD